ncbi:MAG: septal ring lytic transglycosylase RlpA family protein [Candidatus Peregrinibacteria bacterium]
MIKNIKKHFSYSLILALLLIQQVYAVDVFTDVSSVHPHYEAITALHEQGIIQGYENNTYRPDQLMNRAEALKIILLGSDIFVPDIQPGEIFPDVVYGVWYAKYVAKAKNLNIVGGDSHTGLFRPGDTINLAEILKVLIEANGISVKFPSEHPYLDVPPDAWFAPYFDYAKVVGLLDPSGDEDVFPAMPVNRGLMAELIYRIGQKPKADGGYGKASYYGETFHGRTTASGEVFDASDFTAAHRTYPFGTWLKVTNMENNETVLVRVNDRGPYAGDDRVIDLSKAAFESISPLSRGVITVTVEISSAPADPSVPETETASDPQPPADEPADAPSEETVVPEETVPPETPNLQTQQTACPEKQGLHFLARDFFENILLDQTIPSHVVVDEVLTLSGKTTVFTNALTAFLVDESGKQTAFSTPVTDRNFSVNVPFSVRGNYQFGLIPAKEGTSLIQTLTVLPYACLQESERSSRDPVTGLGATVEDGESRIYWNKGAYNLFQLTFLQEGQFKRVIVHDVDHFQPRYADFKDFKAGAVAIHLRGGILTDNSLLEPAVIEWSPATTLTVDVVTHEKYIIEADQAEVTRLPQPARNGRILKVEFKPKTAIRSDAALILPNGDVKDIVLSGVGQQPIKNQNGLDVFPPSNDTVEFSFRPAQTGLHFIEINNAEGLAAINIPVYAENTFPLLPNLMELQERKTVDLGNDLSALHQPFLNLVNKDRQTFGKSAVALDNPLSQLAQHRADDMAQNNYFSHWDRSGRDSNTLRKDFAITQVIAENLAKDVNLEFAEYGLMHSAIHRKNLLNGDWTRVGFGISRHADGTYVFVQIFSEDPLDLSNMASIRQTILKTANANRTNPLVLRDDLETLAQAWTERMANEDFFEFNAPDGTSIFDVIQAANLTTRVGTYIVGNISFAAALGQIAENSALQNGSWQGIGIGVKQDSVGIIKVTLIYSE